MSMMQLHVMDPEEAAARQLQVLIENEDRERRRVARANRAAGHKRPERGDVLHVEAARGIRGRARHRFSAGSKTPITVVGDDDELKPGCVRQHEAELILADTGLLVGTKNATEVEASDLRAALAVRDVELEGLRAENAKLLRLARQSAPDDPNGGPARLRAADHARTELGIPAPERPQPVTQTDDFGPATK